MSCIPLFNGQIPHFHDARGNLANGFKLHFYLHNTSTTIDVFKDAEGRVAYTNPIVLDARGETETQIYVNPSFAYKMVLKDRKGAVVYSADSITADGVVDLPEYIMGTVEGSELVSVQTKVVGENIKYIVYMNDTFSDTIATKEEVEDLETALGNVKDTFYFSESTTGSAFADAYSKGKFLVYQNGVTSSGPRPTTTTRNFVLVKKENYAGSPTTSLLFACLDGETIYKVSIGYNMVAETLTFGEVESYAVKGKDDELASTIASNQETTNENFRTMGTTLSQGLNQLQATKLSAVSHDATLEGDGTQANPLKVIGGGGGGIPEAPTDGKQYARKDGEWAEVEAGASSWEDISGKPSTFPPSTHTHTKSQITDLVVPTKVSDLTNDSGFIDKATFTATYNTTTFADIKSAVDNGYCVKCDVSGYTYELVQALSDKITFALTNNVNGTISQETIWVTSDDEWDGEGVNVAKASDVKSKTSELTNDAGFLTDAPADGKQYCRKDNAWAEVQGGGGSEVGYTSTILWDYQENGGGVIKYGTNQNYTLNDSIDNYDELLFEFYSLQSDASNPDYIRGTTQFFVNVQALKNAHHKDYTSLTSFGTRCTICHIYENKFIVTAANTNNDNGIIHIYGIKHGYVKSGIVHIGEHDYHWKRVGSQLWMTENLKETFGLTSGFTWYNNDQATYEPLGCGLLYFPEFITNSGLLNADFNGWKLPTPRDFELLKSMAYASTSVGTTLKSTSVGKADSWNPVGTDFLGLNIGCAGYAASTTSFGNYNGDYVAFRTRVSSYSFFQIRQSSVQHYTDGGYNGYSIRLVKNLSDFI